MEDVQSAGNIANIGKTGIDTVNSAFHVAKEDGILWVCIFLLVFFGFFLSAALWFWKDLVDTQKQNGTEQTAALGQVPIILNKIEQAVCTNKEHNSAEHNILSSKFDRLQTEQEKTNQGINNLRFDLLKEKIND